jgi:hypothetical protein
MQCGVSAAKAPGSCARLAKSADAFVVRATSESAALLTSQSAASRLIVWATIAAHSLGPCLHNGEPGRDFHRVPGEACEVGALPDPAAFAVVALAAAAVPARSVRRVSTRGWR